MTERPADLVREACDQLAGYLPALERLVAEPAADTALTGTRAHASSRNAETPEPWNVPAGRALMDAHAAARRVEDDLHRAVFGEPAPPRGGSDGNTDAALGHIPDLAVTADDYERNRALRELAAVINEARAVPAIDEAQRWRPLPRQPGEALPPRCPYCGCYQLRVALDSSGRPTARVECFVPDCQDGNGYRPVAQMGTDEHGRPVLAWADGYTEAAPDAEEAA